MNFSVKVRRAAELDIAQAQLWYESQRNGLGAEFYFEVSQIFARLLETPLIYPALHRDVRRAIVHRFPYLKVSSSSQRSNRFGMHARQTGSQQNRLSHKYTVR